jgi:hypothetical protein
MATRLINSIPGKIKDDSLISFSYSEDATPLEPTSSDGGTSQVSFSAIEETADAGLVNTKLMVNNTVSIQDDDYGTVQFDVKKVSTNAAGVASIIGDSIQAKLNVIKTAQPFSGTLAAAIDYYCSLCGITGASRVIDISFLGRSVNFIGWTGNVWDHLKQLCSVMTLNTTDRSPIEIYFTGTAVGFRPALTNSINIEPFVSDQNESIEIFDAAQTVNVHSYNTVNKTNSIVYDLSFYEETANTSKKQFLSSLNRTIQVNAGETVTEVFTIDASLTSVKQPDCVAKISPIPYDPLTTGNGQYVIVGSDDLPIRPSQWIAQGGSLVVALTENPNEIKITITAPNATELPKENGNGTGLAPYRIGVESAGSGFDYPAIFIVGSGVFYRKTKHTFPTGANPSVTTKPEAPEVDNIFITDNFTLANAGLSAAQAMCGPAVTMSGSSASGFTFGSSIGRSFNANSNRFRLNSVSFNEREISWDAKSMTTFSNFNTVNSGKTFAQFNTVLPSPSANFTDFSIIPLTIGV